MHKSLSCHITTPRTSPSPPLPIQIFPHLANCLNTSALPSPGQNISDSFLKELSWAISRQISNWQKLVSYLGLSHADLLEVRVQQGGGSAEEQCLQLLRRWRERHREGRALLRMRLMRAGVDFDTLLSSLPGGQVQGVEHMVIGRCMSHDKSCADVCVVYYMTGHVTRAISLHFQAPPPLPRGDRGTYI